MLGAKVYLGMWFCKGLPRYVVLVVVLSAIWKQTVDVYLNLADIVV